MDCTLLYNRERPDIRLSGYLTNEYPVFVLGRLENIQSNNRQYTGYLNKYIRLEAEFNIRPDTEFYIRPIPTVYLSKESGQQRKKESR